MEIRVEGLRYVYAPKTPWSLEALHDVSFTVGSGQVLGILGTTGSGKTTLLKNLNGLLTPTSGSILLDGEDVSLFRSQAPKMVGLVFQCPERQLFEQTVLEDITFPFRIDNELTDEEMVRRSRLACEDVGLDLEKIGGMRPNALSAASRRKLAIACVLVNDPETLILDEPLASMDPYSSLELVRMIARMKSRQNRTIIIVSHDMAPFMTLLDLLMILDKGRLRAFGSCGDVFDEISDDAELFKLAPPMAHLRQKLISNGFQVPKNEFDPCAIVEHLSVAPEPKDFRK